MPSILKVHKGKLGPLNIISLKRQINTPVCKKRPSSLILDLLLKMCILAAGLHCSFFCGWVCWARQPSGWYAEPLIGLDLIGLDLIVLVLIGLDLKDLVLIG